MRIIGFFAFLLLFTITSAGYAKAEGEFIDEAFLFSRYHMPEMTVSDTKKCIELSANDNAPSVVLSGIDISALQRTGWVALGEYLDRNASSNNWVLVDGSYSDVGVDETYSIFPYGASSDTITSFCSGFMSLALGEAGVVSLEDSMKVSQALTQEEQEYFIGKEGFDDPEFQAGLKLLNLLKEDFGTESSKKVATCAAISLGVSQDLPELEALTGIWLQILNDKFQSSEISNRNFSSKNKFWSAAVWESPSAVREVKGFSKWNRKCTQPMAIRIRKHMEALVK